MAEKSKRQQEKKMEECPFSKKRKIDDSDQADLIATDEIISNSDENMPESLNEDQTMEEEQNGVIESGEG